MDIFTASSLGNLSCVEKRCKRRKNKAMKINCEGWSALMYACVYGHEKIVTYLRNMAPSCIYIKNRNNQTSLMLASQNNNLKIVKSILRNDIVNWTDNRGWTALFYAVYFDNHEIIKFLVDSGANMDIKDFEGKTALTHAALGSNQFTIELMLQLGAKQIMAPTVPVSIHQAVMEIMNTSLDLDSLLNHLSLSKYIPILKENNVDFDKFLKFNEQDLASVGIKLLGPRRRMYLAISQLNKILTAKKLNKVFVDAE